MDIERQLAALGFSKSTQTVKSCQPPVQGRLVKPVMFPPTDTIDAEYLRRDAAINAIANYCKVEEGRPRLHSNRQGPSSGKAGHGTSKKLNTTTQLTAAVLLIFRDQRPRICFLYLGNERLPLKQRFHSF